MCGGFRLFFTILHRLQRRTINTNNVCGVLNLRHCYYSTATCENKSFHKNSVWTCTLNASVSDVLSNTVRKFSTAEETSHQTFDYIDASDKDLHDILAKDMIVHKDFLSEEEENSLLHEVERYMSRLRYEFDHWDNAIHGFRETEKKSWNEKNSEIIKRVQNLAFGTHTVPLPFVHVLDIAKEGYIKPHVDAVRFCGDTIAGMCLMSSCVMRLALEKDSSKYGDLYLPRRCLYLMKDRARYEFTHEVLQKETSIFRNQAVPRDRRISIICRCEPNAEHTE
uniref:Alpha-ketoglutarate-dependent dioxygenase AlkB-like domain-containing protein n=2 Tax=Arion vulgaris TaxID=1028688 RepID=A0A0B7A0F7_9EUPU